MRKQSSKAPSLADVARLAGVSPQTASRVSSGSDLVTASTTSRVRAAMDELGYVPNRAARALRQGAYRAIGVVTQQLERTGESMSVAGIVESATDYGYTVTVVQIGEPKTEALKQAWQRLGELPIDGMIILRVGVDFVDQVQLPARMPIEVFDSSLAGIYPSVIGDEVQGTRDLIQHLIDLGHRNIHHIVGAADSGPALVRRDAFLSTLAENGIPDGRLWQGDWTIESGYQAGLQIAKDQEVTAVFCSNDGMAFGLVRALQDSGLRVPKDISVAGFDGTETSRFATPPLTTIQPNFRSVSKKAVSRLIRQIEKNYSPSLEPDLVPTTLLIRESTSTPSPERLARALPVA